MSENLLSRESSVQLASMFSTVLESSKFRNDKLAPPEISRALSHAEITPYFKEDIQKKLQQVLSDKERLRRIGTSFILDICGINLHSRNYGIFDSEKAQEVERRHLEREYNNLNNMLIPDLRIKRQNVLDAWKKEFERVGK